MLVASTNVWIGEAPLQPCRSSWGEPRLSLPWDRARGILPWGGKTPRMRSRGLQSLSFTCWRACGNRMFYLVELGDLRGLCHCKCWGEVSLGIPGWVQGEEGTVIPNPLDTSWAAQLGQLQCSWSISKPFPPKKPFSLGWSTPPNALNRNWDGSAQPP